MIIYQGSLGSIVPALGRGDGAADAAPDRRAALMKQLIQGLVLPNLLGNYDNPQWFLPLCQFVGIVLALMKAHQDAR